MNSTSADFQNLYQALSRSAARSPDALALAFEDRRYLYRDFHLRVQRAMAQLDRGWSLRKGDRILLAWGNHPAFCEVLFAALGLGIEVVPFSTKLKQAESEALVGHIAPRVVLFDATVQDWLKNTPDARAVSLSEWQALCLPEPLTRPPVPVNRDDTAVMMFTSGTTGEPKGAIITHNNLLCAIDAYTQKLNLTAADSTILAVPIYHITGLSALLALFISLGASIWLQHRFNAPQVITTLREQNITFLHGSPTIFILLCQAAREQSVNHPSDFPALRTIACGAGHLSDGLIKELKTLFPHTAIQPIYGLTETTSPATIFPGDVWGSDKCGSSGQAIPGLAITIRNDRQQPLPAGQIGHIWLKGDVVIREYWQHSERRPSCDAQGWFCTGDLGYLDDEGWLYIKDRSKDMINRGGEKIYSLELENILSTYRGVREVAVIPTPSPVYGEEPVAFIVPDGQHHLTSEEILDWLKVKIARFKLPSRLIFSRALPGTHIGKVSKQQLKPPLAETIITLSTEDKK
ncbi:class I adenylate-forming enzyme family protein [Klebsiella pneumoniae]|uniref:class I adenylate-forming enzyme family protein n=1 Tax=Klebsiella pneumoniae TaxID=573 RepID=UPI000D653979|nr:class I adenylate-forming enzyme family protein [Klebsiella pneumoniae]